VIGAWKKRLLAATGVVGVLESAARSAGYRHSGEVFGDKGISIIVVFVGGPWRGVSWVGKVAPLAAGWDNGSLTERMEVRW
jgi:hypothetical protein